MLYSTSLLVIYFRHSSVYVLTPVFWSFVMVVLSILNTHPKVFIHSFLPSLKQDISLLTTFPSLVSTPFLCSVSEHKALKTCLYSSVLHLNLIQLSFRILRVTDTFFFRVTDDLLVSFFFLIYFIEV